MGIVLLLKKVTTLRMTKERRKERKKERKEKKEKKEREINRSCFLGSFDQRKMTILAKNSHKLCLIKTL